MKKIALLLITLLATFLSQAQDVQSFVNHQLQTYPKSRFRAEDNDSKDS